FTKTVRLTNTMQTQTSITLHNAIMEAGGKDLPPMLAPVFEGSPITTTERTQQATTKNRGKAIVNSPPPIYDQEPSMVAEDDEMSKDKEIDKLMALISLSFKKIYKPTNNNLRTSSNTSRANQDNSLRINRGTGYDNQRIARECQKPKRAKDAAYHREKMLLCKQEEVGFQLNAEQADWRDDTDDESKDQELEVSNNDHYNVFAIESNHPEQSKSVNDTYPIEQDEHNVITDSLDMSYDREQIDQNDDDDDLANERELLASLIAKLKYEIDDSKNRNKFLETSNKVLVDKLKGMLCLPNEDIFAGLAQMGYEKPVRKGFSGVETPLFEGMIADRQPAKEELGAKQVQVNVVVAVAVVEDVAKDVAHRLEIVKLKARVKKLEKTDKVKSSKFWHLRKLGASRQVKSSDDIEDVFNQGRMMNEDEGIELVKDAEIVESEGRQADKQAEIYNIDMDHSSKVLSMQEDDTEVQEVVEVVTTTITPHQGETARCNILINITQDDR
nr:hypothetical protein [Tanacetum cinerariifolium]